MATVMIEEGRRRTAPFERPRGHRGLRGLLAVLAAIAPVVALVAAHAHGTTQSTGGGSGYSFTWTSVFAHQTPAVVLWIAAAVLVIAAGALWRARTRWLIGLALIGVIAAAAASAWAIANARRHASPTASAFNALALGSSEATTVARLGEPLAANAEASPVRGGPTLPCLLYTVGDRATATVVPTGTPPPNRIGAADDGWALLCFAHGRLAVRLGTQ